MRLLVSALLVVQALNAAASSDAPAPARPRVNFSIAAGDPDSWPRILTSMGLPPAAGEGDILVITSGDGAPDQWPRRVEHGAFVVLEGASNVAAAFGITPTAKRLPARSVADAIAPELDIIWEQAIEVPVFELPPQARIFAKERWTGAPLVAGWRQGAGAVLWTAVSPGKRGYERFPYLPQAMRELGVQPIVESRSLWAFFDASYRSRVDLDYFARRWRESGIGALHVAAWHFWESDPERDAYMKRLIEACHKRSIHVYAWVEFPHVSQKFWDDHPEWREKTALEQDAHLDWRRLMNLQNPDAKRAIAEGLRGLAARFDWDGINLAELYFESLEGYGNAARFTPMNDNVRAEFTAKNGFDPLELFREGSPRHHSRNGEGMRKLLDFRAALAHRMQIEWLDELERIRAQRPHLDLVLTHVDDRFDTRMRDLIGADAERLLPTLEARAATFLIEDPATVWNLGPERYPEIAAKYKPITEKPDKLAIDINIVERYQDVYPTKKQTGAELFQLVHMASGGFPRVALYFESSLLSQDLPLLAASGARVDNLMQAGTKLAVEARGAHAVRWTGAAAVDGKLWPVGGQGTVRIPGGAHTITQAQSRAPISILDLGAELTSASASDSSSEIGYDSQARAWTLLDRKPARIELDGAPAEIMPLALGDGTWLVELPRGQHLATFAIR
ncbi:MAG: hypothetical protein ABI972_04425 [Acidobacteriota bacterium]